MQNRLQIFNSMTAQKEIFEPIRENQIGFYVCGMTVYDYCHLGHGRLFVAYDAIVRYLRSQGWQVHYVRNITDIEDKIIRRAAQSGRTAAEVVAHFLQIQREDEQRLGCLVPDHEPRATEYVPAMVECIARLIEKNAAYVDEAGDVCFAVSQFADYGKLSKRNLEDLRAGSRVEINTAKRDPLDFVLWKLAKPGEPSWPSPWGLGRPGWHIECSVMSTGLLGQPFDLHGGGIDLKFPHHENEIAQAEADCGCEMARFWLHLGHLQINNEKMSKSLGNFYTIRDLMDQHSPEVLRFFLLSSHYRSPMNFSLEHLQNAKQGLTRLYNALRGVSVPVLKKAMPDFQDAYSQRIIHFMNDDFNTPEAFSILFELSSTLNAAKQAGQTAQAQQWASILQQWGLIFGILQENPEHFLQAGVGNDTVQKIESLIAQRQAARLEKKWQRADELRLQLHEMGIEIEDTVQGTTWRTKDGRVD